MIAARRTSLLLLLLLAIASVHAIEPIDGKLALVRSQALGPQVSTRIVLFRPVDGSLLREEFAVERSATASGGFLVSSISPTFTSREEFRADGSLISSAQAFKPEGVSSLIRVEADGKAFLSSTSKAKTSSHTLDKTKGLVYGPEFSHIQVQAWAAGLKKGFSFRSPTPDGGSTYEFSLSFVETARPLALSRDYAYPPEFAEAFEKEGRYVVAELRLAGMAALFYPHVMRFIYEASGGPLEFRGYWGGEPAKASFQYVKE